jgi:hypothetical protein
MNKQSNKMTYKKRSEEIFKELESINRCIAYVYIPQICRAARDEYDNENEITPIDEYEYEYNYDEQTIKHRIRTEEEKRECIEAGIELHNEIRNHHIKSYYFQIRYFLMYYLGGVRDFYQEREGELDLEMYMKRWKEGLNLQGYILNLKVGGLKCLIMKVEVIA